MTKYRVTIEFYEDGYEDRVSSEGYELGYVLGYALAGMAPYTSRLDLQIAEAILECDEFSKAMFRPFDSEIDAAGKILLEAAGSLKEKWDTYDESANKGTVAE